MVADDGPPISLHWPNASCLLSLWACNDGLQSVHPPEIESYSMVGFVLAGIIRKWLAGNPRQYIVINMIDIDILDLDVSCHVCLT